MSRSSNEPPRLADPRKDADDVRRTLERAVASVCPRWLAADREDIVQIALLKVFAAAERTGEQDRPLARSYLWKVAYSATADEIRRRRRVELPMEEPDLERRADLSEDPHRRREAQELGRAIQDCLRRTVEPRRVVVQFHLLGHGLAEIERLTSWNAKRVRNLLYRGIANLRDCLSKKGYGT